MKCILCEGEIEKKYNTHQLLMDAFGSTVLNKISKLKERVKELSKGLTRTEPKHRNKRRNVALLKDVIDLEEKYLEKKIQLIALSSRDDAEVDLKTVL